MKGYVTQKETNKRFTIIPTISVILMASVLVIVFMLFSLKLNQLIVIVSLIFTIISWIINKPKKTISSLFLLTVFLIFGDTSVTKVLSFPLSPNFLLIILSFVFSQGIINSKLTEKLFQPFIGRYSENIYQFLGMMVLIIIGLVFTIPQPYSRVIMLVMIYQSYFEEIKLNKLTKEVLLFGIYAINIIVHIFFKKGDIILNNGILAVTNIQMSEIEWMKNLLLPGIGMLLLALISFFVVFRKELKLFRGSSFKNNNIVLNRDDKINLAIILLTIVLWSTEHLHNINGAIVVILAICLMYFRSIISLKDLKCINEEVIIFLTAAFSIGPVMVGSGMADKLFGSLTRFLPGDFSLRSILFIIGVTMALHMVLGSSVTTMSVIIPSFISLLGSSIDHTLIMFLVFVSLLTQYLLPVHNALLAVGAGNNHFNNKIVFKFGLACLPVTLISIFLFFIPWWKFIGLI